jgi:hypothetical protein
VCRYTFDHLPCHQGTAIHVWITFVKNGSNCRNVPVTLALLSDDVLGGSVWLVVPSYAAFLFIIITSLHLLMLRHATQAMKVDDINDS